MFPLSLSFIVVNKARWCRNDIASTSKKLCTRYEVNLLGWRKNITWQNGKIFPQENEKSIYLPSNSINSKGSPFFFSPSIVFFLVFWKCFVRKREKNTFVQSFFFSSLLNAMKTWSPFEWRYSSHFIYMLIHKIKMEIIKFRFFYQMFFFYPYRTHLKTIVLNFPPFIFTFTHREREKKRTKVTSKTRAKPIKNQRNTRKSTLSLYNSEKKASNEI